jgi:hypothetical protein
MRRILVFDDDPHICLAIRAWLEGYGFRVSIADGAGNGFAAQRDALPAQTLQTDHIARRDRSMLVGGSIPAKAFFRRGRRCRRVLAGAAQSDSFKRDGAGGRCRPTDQGSMEGMCCV